MRLPTSLVILLFGACWGISEARASPPDGAERSCAREVIVYTANQSWLSRIYVMGLDGLVLNYFEYEYYIFSDLEVVNNEVYVTDWVAPRVYRVDIETGALDVVVDDWNLIYMYDLAWDGSHFYLNEWSLNRYDFDGSWAGGTSFDETVRGGACDGTYYWTLNNQGQMKCWDISNWPTVIEVPENAFDPPSPACRGLWYDGSTFWSAERLDGALGWIYQFDHEGTVIRQWLEPAFAGYAAGVVTLGPVFDLDGDGAVGSADLAVLLGAWGPNPGHAAEFNGDALVDAADLALLLGHWGPCA